jgi:hypothetical protein
MKENFDMENNLKPEEVAFLELRMYFFVIYQLSGRQIGIQAGHSALEYARKFGDTEEFKEFADLHKTWVILNGGTANDARDFNEVSKGTLNQIADQLFDNDIQCSYFFEPDLNDTLTAVCFICDERVFNREKYPDQIYNNISDESPYTPNDDNYKSWVRSVGGVKNVFLRELIKDKKLA